MKRGSRDGVRRRLARLGAVMGLVLAGPGSAVEIASAAATEMAVEVAGQRYRVELAVTDADRIRGLMYRDHLDADRGMLFVWRDAAPRTIWMKNTRIPLDIVFLDAARTIVAVAPDAQPCRVRNCPVYPSGYPAQYVLEINAGEIRRLGAAVGDPVRFIDEPASIRID